MAPIIHCVRHGQGLHNVTGQYDLRDPDLTSLGEAQCEYLKDSTFVDQSKISLVASSPMLRALHTAWLTFSPALTSHGQCSPKILAIPDAQETSDDGCDIGSNPSTLRQVIAKNTWPVDLTLVKNGWNVKTLESRYSPHSDAINTRARDTRLFLRRSIRKLVQDGNPNPEVVLVAHGGFMHYFTGDWEDSYNFPGTGWRNCETRSYLFEGNFLLDNDKEARVFETEISRQRRGKTQPMPRKEDQLGMFLRCMEQWESQGLQRPDKLPSMTITQMECIETTEHGRILQSRKHIF